MAMAMDVLEMLGPMEEKGRGVAKERQTMLLLRRGVAGEPPSPVSGVREIAPRIASTACSCSPIYSPFENVALLQSRTDENVVLLQSRIDKNVALLQS
jgi:hypothetical protein